ncbi:hypothetical protein PSPO_a0784 [Pseudoalteromonas spongiae UST010723-006]|nr:hypothetical protein PSPO_a0784 [Pseudoalteromonas spongiae UST010723-006]
MEPSFMDELLIQVHNMLSFSKAVQCQQLTVVTPQING